MLFLKSSSPNEKKNKIFFEKIVLPTPNDGEQLIIDNGEKKNERRKERMGEKKDIRDISYLIRKMAALKKI